MQDVAFEVVVNTEMYNQLKNGGRNEHFLIWSHRHYYSSEGKKKSNSFEQISCITRNVLNLDRNFASVNSFYTFPMMLMEKI